MKLDNNCVRDLLLYIEEETDLSESICIESIPNLSYSADDLLYTAMKLQEAGYVNADVERTYDIENGGYSITVFDLTWQGHKFLDNIRDNAVWKTTKGIVSKFSSVSLGIIESVAAQVITNMINQHLGQSDR